MFVEKYQGNVHLRAQPRVNSQRVESLVVEEELLRLILELNPQVRFDAKTVVLGQRNIATAELAASVAEMDSNREPETAVESAESFDQTAAEYSDDNNIRQLIALLPSPPSQVNPMYRERLLRFFERYDKYRLPTVSKLLRRYVGQENALFASLVEEYGPEPTFADKDYFNEGMPALPEGWCRMESSRGDVYYKNLSSKEVSWTRPRNESADEK